MKILVIGDAMFDKYTYARNYRRSPEDPDVPVFDVDEEKNLPGGALNVAANIASLVGEKHQVDFIGIIGPQGDIDLYKNVYNICLDVNLCRFVAYNMTKHRLVDVTRRKQVVRIDEHPTFNREDIDAMSLRIESKKFKRILKAFDYIVVSDYGKGTVSSALSDSLSRIDKPVFVDTKNPNLHVWSDISRCLVKINAREYSRCEGSNSVNLIVTDGSRGSTFTVKGNQRIEASIAGEAVEHADCVGAGDVYLAGLVSDFAFRCGTKVEFTPLHVRAAMAQADFAARASVRCFGTTVVDAKSIEKEIGHDDYRHAG